MTPDMKSLGRAVVALICRLAVPALVLWSPTMRAQAPQAAPTAAVIFEDVRIFDGRSAQLSPRRHVMVTGNLIQTISATPIVDPPGAAVTRIRGNGRTLMPGLIDAHWHVLLVGISAGAAIDGDLGYSTLVAAVQAEQALMRGFTTVRDMGGPSFSLKRAIDEGLLPGPRIYPSGAMITITGGHGDFRRPTELPRVIGAPQTRMEQINGSLLADSPDEVRVRVREQLLLGASQIKLTAGGGVASPHSPLDVSTFTEDELRAAVQAAANWGTYVAVHAYTPAAIQRAIAAGVKVIEHGHLMDDETAALMAKSGIWLSFQPFTDNEAAAPLSSPVNQARQLLVIAGTERTVALARKHKLKLALGTDILFSPAAAKLQNAEFAKMAKWFTPAEVLAMATGTNGELLRLTGPRNPYPGKLGVVEQGALADLLLVDGDPLADLNLIADPQGKFLVIMKDGKIVKNTVR
jgi:imidazolonepropionase-like amidohydrolase